MSGRIKVRLLPFNVDRANCYGIAQPAYERAFGDTEDVEEPYDTEDAEKFAEVFCSGCPVRQLCLDYAMKNDEQFGVWGGKTPEERFKMRG